MTSLLTESEHAKFQKLEATAAKAAADRQALADSIADREGQWHSLTEALAGLAAATTIARSAAEQQENEIKAHWGHCRGTQGRRDGSEHKRIVGELAVLIATKPLYEQLAVEKEEQLAAAIKAAKEKAASLGIDRQHWPAPLLD